MIAEYSPRPVRIARAHTEQLTKLIKAQNNIQLLKDSDTNIALDDNNNADELINDKTVILSDGDNNTDELLTVNVLIRNGMTVMNQSITAPIEIFAVDNAINTTIANVKINNYHYLTAK